MKPAFLIISLFLLSLSTAYAQNEKILMTIGDQTVSIEEFERIYNKNNVAGLAEKQPVEEYLDLFINFKLKVLEAENLGMDTLESFKKELKGYRDQLAKPYINDSSIKEDLIRQQYERMKTELHTSHIMMRVDQRIGPADTLRVYNLLMDIRKRIMNGEDFEKLAREYSEDPSVGKNGGDIGWMTAFRNVWEFENAIYNTPLKEVSLPIKTQFGYHIIKVWEKRPSSGSVKVAHIFISAPESLTPEMKKQSEMKMMAVYDSLKQGVSFEELVKNNSDDRNSANRGGELQWFGSGQMISEFEDAAFSIKKIGEYSKPVESFYGWHLIKLLDKKGFGTYEELRPELYSKVTDPQMANVLKNNYINKLKKDFNYSFNKDVFEKLSNQIDTTIFSGTWNDSLLRNNKETLFSIEQKNFSVADFAHYLYTTQRKTNLVNIPVFLNDQFKTFSSNALQDYEKDLLPSKYPEFKYILQEYHDGILLFDLTDKMVWSKAVIDTAGLEKFYQENKSQYMWEKRANAMFFSSDSAELIAKAKELVLKYGNKKKFSKDFILSQVCKADSIKNCINIQESSFEKGDNEEVDKTGWNPGLGENFESEGLTSFVFIRSVSEPQIKKLDEARGLITADYQNYLEKAWIAELRAKYPVNVDYKLLNSIK